MQKSLVNSIVLAFSFPLFAMAQDVYDIYDIIFSLLRSAVTLLYLVIVVAFLWGAMLFIQNASDEKKREEGKKWMLGAVIAMAVAFSISTIINFLFNTFGVQSVLIPPLGS